MAAILIDSLLIAAVSFGAWLAVSVSVPGHCVSGGITIGGRCHALGFRGGADHRAAWYGIVVGLNLLYFVVLQGLTGRTLGKAMLGIRVVREDGSNPGILRALLRYVFLLFIDGFPYVIPYLVGFITALSSQRNQRVGDMVSGTFVVNAAAAGQRVPVAAGAAPAGYGGAPGYGAPPGGYGGGYAQPAAPRPQPQPAVTPAAAAPAQPAAQPGGTPAGWYPDPHGQARIRYWDGNTWTEHTSA